MQGGAVHENRVHAFCNTLMNLLPKVSATVPASLWMFYVTPKHAGHCLCSGELSDLKGKGFLGTLYQ